MFGERGRVEVIDKSQFPGKEGRGPKRKPGHRPASRFLIVRPILGPGDPWPASSPIMTRVVLHYYTVRLTELLC